MPELYFHVEDAAPARLAAAPLLVFKLAIRDKDPAPQPIQAIALRCQVRIEPARRRYTPAEQEKLGDLFGTPDRWGQTLRGLLWMHASTMVPSFTGSTVAELPLPCTYDFDVAATKYCGGLDDGDIPLLLLFSGTIFYQAEHGIQVAQVPWDRETTFRLPAQVWRDLMDQYYPNSAWLRLRKDVFDRLHEYRRRHGLATWEQALEQLLPAAEGSVTP